MIIISKKLKAAATPNLENIRIANEIAASMLNTKGKGGKTESLVSLLDQRLAGWEADRSHKVVHMSDLSHGDGFCPREFALLDVTNKKPKGQYVSTALRVTFDNGEALAALCRNKWLGDDVIGTWVCKTCKDKRIFTTKPSPLQSPCKCGKSKGLWEYHEEQFIDPVSKASGSIDFFIRFDPKGLAHVVEVKTISKDDFKTLKGPLAEHRIRTNLYLHLIATSGRPEIKQINLKSAFVLYISKGFGAKTEETGKVTPFREFKVDYDPKEALPYFKKASIIFAFRNGGPMPEGICQTGMDKRVGLCAAGKDCWSGSYPAGVKK